MDTSALVLGLRVVLALAVVLGLLWWLARRAGGGRARAKVTTVSVVGRQSLGRHSGVAVVEVEGRRLLLGVTDQGVSLLTELAVTPVAEPAAERVEIDPEDLARLVGDLDLDDLDGTDPTDGCRSCRPRHPDGRRPPDRSCPPVDPRGTDARGPHAPQPPRGIDPGAQHVASGGGCGAGTDHQALTAQPVAPAGRPTAARRRPSVLFSLGLVVLIALALAVLGTQVAYAAGSPVDPAAPTAPGRPGEPR